MYLNSLQVALDDGVLTDLIVNCNSPIDARKSARKLFYYKMEIRKSHSTVVFCKKCENVQTEIALIYTLSVIL